MVIIGIDHGKKRVGIAKSDELGMFAHALCFFKAEPEEELFRKIANLIDETKAEICVVGLPLQMDGSEGIAAQGVMAFVERMKAVVTIPIEAYDERLTTAEAMEYLRASGMSGKKKRKKVDALAAQIMLQGYIDEMKASN